jgi:hypothetical protein
MDHHSDNSKCVKVDSTSPFHMMDVTAPELAEVRISPQGVVWVNVNGICVFRLCKPKTLEVINEYIKP